MVTCAWSFVWGRSAVLILDAVTILIFHGCRLNADGEYRMMSRRADSFFSSIILPWDRLRRVSLRDNVPKLHDEPFRLLSLITSGCGGVRVKKDWVRGYEKTVKNYGIFMYAVMASSSTKAGVVSGSEITG